MSTTFDFDEWLDAADPCDAPNVAGLVEVVEDGCEFSGFKAERAPNGKLIVSADGLELKLILVSKEAEEAFVRRIHARFVPSGPHFDAVTSPNPLSAWPGHTAARNISRGSRMT